LKQVRKRCLRPAARYILFWYVFFFAHGKQSYVALPSGNGMARVGESNGKRCRSVSVVGAKAEMVYSGSGCSAHGNENSAPVLKAVLVRCATPRANGVEYPAVAALWGSIFTRRRDNTRYKSPCRIIPYEAARQQSLSVRSASVYRRCAPRKRCLGVAPAPMPW